MRYYIITLIRRDRLFTSSFGLTATDVLSAPYIQSFMPVVFTSFLNRLLSYTTAHAVPLLDPVIQGATLSVGSLDFSSES